MSRCPLRQKAQEKGAAPGGFHIRHAPLEGGQIGIIVYAGVGGRRGSNLRGRCTPHQYVRRHRPGTCSRGISPWRAESSRGKLSSPAPRSRKSHGVPDSSLLRGPGDLRPAHQDGQRPACRLDAANQRPGGGRGSRCRRKSPAAPAWSPSAGDMSCSAGSLMFISQRVISSGRPALRAAWRRRQGARVTWIYWAAQPARGLRAWCGLPPPSPMAGKMISYSTMKCEMFAIPLRLGYNGLGRHTQGGRCFL